MRFCCRTLLLWYISFFSAFHSKQINIMTYFYSYVFDNNDSNPSLHEEQLPAIAARSGFCWLFSHASTGSLQVKTFTRKKDNNNNSNKSKTIQIYRCQCSISGPIDPFRKSHSLCGVYFFPINQSKNWINRFSQRWLYGYIPLRRSQNDPGARDWRRLWRDDARISKKKMIKKR